MHHSPKENLITTKDASELSGYTSDYLARLVRSGEIYGKRIGHSWTIDSASLEAFMNKQKDRKLDRARELASSRVREYNRHNQFVRRTARALTEKASVPQFGFGQVPLRSHALALSVALAVVAVGAVGANAAAVPHMAQRASALAVEISSGFVDTFGAVPSRIATRIEEARTAVRADATRDALASRRAGYAASPILASIDLETLQSVLVKEYRAPRTASGIARSSSRTDAPILTVADVHASVARAYAFLAHPSSIGTALGDAYFAIGADAYAAVGASFSTYRALIDASGTPMLAVAATTRDALARAPHVATQVNLALGEAVISAAHAAIRAHLIAVQGIALAAPESARITVTLIGSVGDTIARATEQAPARIASAYLGAAAAPAVLAPQLAQAVWSTEYAATSRFVAAADAVTDRYLALVEGTGGLAYESADKARAVSGATARSLALASAAIEDALLGTLGKGAVALDSVTHLSSFAAALPALSTSERAALAVYEAIRSAFDSANHALIAFFTTTPSTVLPTGVPKARVIGVATSTRAVSGAPQATAVSYPTYTTVVRGVSEDFMNQSLASLRTNVLATVAGMIQPVNSQVIQNITTTQQLNRIDKLHDLVVQNGDFRNSIFDSGIRVSATDGSFSKLSSGTTTLATTTVTGSLTLNGDQTISGSLTIAALTLTGSLSTPGAVTGSYFVATSTTATSTFAGSLNVDGAGLVYATSTRNVGIGVLSPAALLAIKNSTSTQPIFIASNAAGTEVYRLTNAGFVGIGTTSPTYNLAVEGSSSLGSQAIAGYFTATTTTATSTFAGSLAVGTTSPTGNGLFTVGTSTPLLYVSNTTGRLGIGTTSPSANLGLQGSIGVNASHLYLAENGNVGIGTTSPYRTLSVAGSGVFTGGDVLASTLTATSTITSSATTTATHFAASTLGFAGAPAFTFSSDLNTGLWSSIADTLNLSTAGSERLRIDSSGNVGIGTTSPWGLLSINPNGISGPSFVVGSSTATNFIVTNGGNVGIGTTSPSAALSVAGNALLSGTTGATFTGAGAGIVFSGTGNHDISATGGTLRIGSNTVIGNIEALDNTIDIGTPATRFDKIYASEVNATTLVGTLTGGNLTAETFTINSDNATADTENSYLAFERGTVSPNALLTWNATSDRFEFNHPLYIENASASTTLTTLDLKAVAGQTADLFRIASSSGSSLFSVAASGLVTFASGFLSNASSTITSGLFSMNGGASTTQLTTTGSAYLATAGGNVGIGTAASSYTLDVTGNARFTSLVDASHFVATSSSATSTFAGGLAVATSKLVVDSTTGGVGIGTTSPASKLHVYGSGTITETIESTTADARLHIKSGSTSAYPYITLSRATTNDWDIGADASNNGAFYLYDWTAANKPLSILKTTGNVGIGTTSPYSRLSVWGAGTGATSLFELTNSASTTLASVLNDGTVYMKGNVGIGTTSPYRTLSVAGSGVFTGGDVLASTLTATSTITSSATTTATHFAASTLGFAGAPAFTFSNDLNTGLWSPTADTLALSTAGSERLRIDSSGNVGIGTTSPATTLSVQGNGLFSGTGFFGGAITGTSTLSIQSTTATSTFSTGGLTVGTSQFVVQQSSGNVGIGTTSPQIRGGLASGLNIDGAGDRGVQVNSNSAGGNVFFTGVPGASADMYVTNNLASRLFLGTGSYTAQHMVINSSGNVGIGTTSPTGYYFNTATVLDISGAAAAAIRLERTGATVRNWELGLTTGGNFDIVDTVASLTTPRLRVDTSGNIGINTTSILSKLHVADVNRTIADNSTLTVESTSAQAIDAGGSIGFVGQSDVAGQFAIISGRKENATANNRDGYFQVATYQNGVGLAERMRVTSTGNAGIGTTSPGLSSAVIGNAPYFSVIADDAANNAGVIEVGGNAASADSNVGFLGFVTGNNTNTSAATRRLVADIQVVTPASVTAGAVGGEMIFNTKPDNGTRAERMRITSTGNVGIGTTTPVSTLSVQGSLCVRDTGSCGTTAGTIYATTAAITDIDLAENYQTTDATISAGEIVAFDPANPTYIKRASGASASYLGVVSTAPGLLLGKEIQNSKPVALAGRVPVKVNMDGGPISVGDRITVSSSTPGVGARASTSGESIGIALESAAAPGTVEVFIKPEYSFVPGQLTLDPLTGYVGIGTTTPNHTLSVAGDIGAIAFVNTSTRNAKTDISYATASSSEDRLSQLVNLKVATYRYTIEDQNDPLRLGLIAEDTQTIAPEILSADGKGVDIYELATFTLSGVQALAAKVDAQETRMISLEDRMTALESGAVSSASGSPITFSTSSLASALEGFGVLIRDGIAQFNTLVFRQLVASKDADGTSSAGSVTIVGGNTIAQVTNSLVQPSTKVFVTFNSSVTGSWWVSDKTNGSFRVVLSAPQSGDVSFDYFLVQTEGQIATSTPTTTSNLQPTTSSGTDTEAPVITLLGDNPLHLSIGGTFVEPGVTVTDNVDASVPYATFVNGIATEAAAGSIDTSVQTTYIITYSATDARGNLATATRSVIVGSATAVPSGTGGTSSPSVSADTTAPVVVLIGEAAIQLTVGDTFTDPGATATDETDGTLTASIAVTGSVDTAIEGLYTLTYTATDAAGNAGSVSRVVTVVAAPAPAPAPAI